MSVLMGCLAGCVAVPVAPPASTHATATREVPLPLGVTDTGGGVLRQVLPDYPPTLRAACPPVEDVEVIVWVDASGAVSRVFGYAVDAFPPPWETFYAMVRPAVLQWRFEPLHVVHWAADADGNPHTVDGGPRPFARHLAFHFTCDHGYTQVAVTLIGGASVRQPG